MGDLHAYRQLPRLVEGTPVLAHPDHALHVGCDPATALRWPLPPDVDAPSLARLIDDLRFAQTYAQIAGRVQATGLKRNDFRKLLAALVEAGKAVDGAAASASLRIRVYGDGELGALLTSSLGAAGHQVLSGPVPTSGLDCQLLLATDRLIVDPSVHFALMDSRTPHLPVIVRDGMGVIGPLVLPGATSCLRCVDEHRCDAEPRWPVLAAGLHARCGRASPAIMTATAALAQQEIDELATGLTSGHCARPRLADQRFEVWPSPVRTQLRPVPAHPRCGCTLGSRRPPTVGQAGPLPWDAGKGHH